MAGDMSFDEMESATASYPPNYDLRDEGAEIVGVIRNIRHGVGQFSQTVYHIEVGDSFDGETDDDGLVTVWGNGSLNAQADKAGLEVGDMIGVRNTGETYKAHGKDNPVMDVRFRKADDN